MGTAREVVTEIDRISWMLFGKPYHRLTDSQADKVLDTRDAENPE